MVLFISRQICKNGRLLTLSIFSHKFQINALGRQTLPDWLYQPNILFPLYPLPKGNQQLFFFPGQTADFPASSGAWGTSLLCGTSPDLISVSKT